MVIRVRHYAVAFHEQHSFSIVQHGPCQQSRMLRAMKGNILVFLHLPSYHGT